MQQYYNQTIETMVKGWTRIDMLLALYSRAISAIRAAQAAHASGDDQLLSAKSMEASRFLLGIHSGLNTDEYPIAGEIARLLNFVARRLDEQNYDEAVYFLEKLLNSFEKIRAEAAKLEKDGHIPALMNENGLNKTA